MKRTFLTVGIACLFVFCITAAGAQTTQFLTTVEKALVANPLPAGQTIQRIKLTGDDSTTVLVVRIAKGGDTKAHAHTNNSETVVIYKGAGQLTIDGKTLDVKSGSLHFNPKGLSHAFKNTGDGELIGICIFAPGLK